MIPRRVQKNQVITADLLNNIIDSIRECQIQAGVGYSFSRNAGGTTLTIKRGISGAGSAVQEACPFDVSVATTSIGMDVSVNTGLINGFLPNNIFSKVSSATSGLRYVVLQCESDGKTVTSAGIVVNATPPVPPTATADTAPVSFGILLAVVSGGSQVYKTIPCGNLTARIAPSVQETSTTYSVGARNYIQYYNWVF